MLIYLLRAAYFEQGNFPALSAGVGLRSDPELQRFKARVAGLARSNLVQQGGELAYLIRHDPEFRGVRHEHLVETGRRVRLKGAIPALVQFLEGGLEGVRFSFFVISAAPREIVTSALAGIVAPDHIYGTELEFDAQSGEVRAIKRVPAGYGKVSVIEELQHRFGIAPDRVIYVGDGSSDVHVMLHVNNGDGFTIAVPVLDQILDWRAGEIRGLLERNGLTLHEWEKARTDHVRIAPAPPMPTAAGTVA